MIRILTGNFDYTLSDLYNIQPNTPQDLKAVIKTPYTYNAAVLDNQDSVLGFKATSEGADAYGVLLYSDNELDLPKNAVKDVLRRGVQPVILKAEDGNLELETNAQSVVTLQAGKFFLFPSLPASSFNPPKLNRKVIYSNNKSQGGQFLGASVVRSGASASLTPLNFPVDASRLQEIEEMFELLETSPFFVAHDLPGGLMAVYYGWLNKEPKAEYTGTLNRFEITLNMDVAV